MKRVVVFYSRDLKIQSIVAIVDEPGVPHTGVCRWRDASRSFGSPRMSILVDRH